MTEGELLEKLDEMFVTTGEAAEIMNIKHRESVLRLIREGKVFAEKWGRDWLVSRESAAAYASSERKTGPKSQS